MSNRVNNYILNRGAVIIQSDNGIKIYAAGSAEYDQAKALIVEGDEVGLYNLANSLEDAVKAYKGFRVENDVVFVNNEPLPATLGKRLKGFADEGADYNYLLKFWENLKLNPSYNSVNSLFDFLENVHCPVTKDGLIQCYKVVRSDYLDKYSKTISNKPGTTVKVPRHTVDDNRENHCSTGIHAGGLSYVRWYGDQSDGDRIVKIFIDPKNVVSVPVDRNFTKIRVCEYLVGDEVSWDEVAPTTQTYVLPKDELDELDELDEREDDGWKYDDDEDDDEDDYDIDEDDEDDEEGVDEDEEWCEQCECYH